MPNIFEDEDYLKKDKDFQSLELVFGTAEEVMDTLESLGCQADTLKKYNKDHKHIFSGDWCPILAPLLLGTDKM